MAMSADLGKVLGERVESLVKFGSFRSRSEVLRRGVRLVNFRTRSGPSLPSASAR